MQILEVSYRSSSRGRDKRDVDICLWQNYTRKSGEGLSVMFIVLVGHMFHEHCIHERLTEKTMQWLAGDLANLAGGAMAALLPTMVRSFKYTSARSSAHRWVSLILCYVDHLGRICKSPFHLGCDIQC